MGLVELYQRSVDGMGSMNWPDGRSLLDQPCRLITAFDIIANQKSKMRKPT
jgi:hypothetical protein